MSLRWFEFELERDGADSVREHIATLRKDADDAEAYLRTADMVSVTLPRDVVVRLKRTMFFNETIPAALAEVGLGEGTLTLKDMNAIRDAADAVTRDSR
jgi:hypothetical protein